MEKDFQYAAARMVLNQLGFNRKKRGKWYSDPESWILSMKSELLQDPYIEVSVHDNVFWVYCKEPINRVYGRSATGTSNEICIYWDKFTKSNIEKVIKMLSFTEIKPKKQ